MTSRTLARAVVALGALGAFGACKMKSGLSKYDLRHYPDRDPKRPDARFDRIAVNEYLAAKNHTTPATLSPGYIAGNCAEAPDAEQRAFCEGSWEDLHDKNLVYLAYGKTSGQWSRCSSIASENPNLPIAADFTRYCDGTADLGGESGWYECHKIEHPKLKQLCDERNRALAHHCGIERTDCFQGAGGSYEEPASTSEPAAPACKPNGAIVRSADECCSGTSDYASKATDAQRAEGRERVCIP